MPTGPLFGAKAVICGGVGAGTVTLNAVALLPVPSGVVTLIGPDDAPAGTLARICASLSTLNAVAGVPLKATVVVPVKWLPVMVTSVPTGPLFGAKAVICGGVGVGGGAPVPKTNWYQRALVIVLPPASRSPVPLSMPSRGVLIASKAPAGLDKASSLAALSRVDSEPKATFLYSTFPAALIPNR